MVMEMQQGRAHLTKNEFSITIIMNKRGNISGPRCDALAPRRIKLEPCINLGQVLQKTTPPSTDPEWRKKKPTHY